MTAIYLICAILIFIEIFRNWCIIHVAKKRPTYWYSQLIRYAIGFVFWVVTGAIANGHSITHYQWWAMPIMMVLTCWFVFDYGLTQFRNLMNKILKLGNRPIKFHYLNPKGSWLDQFQCNHPGTGPWFFWKAILMAAGIYLFQSGIDLIWTVKW